MPERSQLKVIIVGGSIAGLTLAHCLDANGIDYVILERRDDIAPQVGASVSLMPNGSRILDQLGLFDEISEKIEPCIFMRTWTGEGKLLSETNSPVLTSKRLGYTITFLERARLLKILYDRLPNKSKVLMSKDVKNIEQHEKQAVVYCKDGSKFTGDVIAGADGIRSSIRTEMRRYIRREGDSDNLEALNRDECSLTAQYSCLFGISKPVKGLQIGHTHRSSTKGASTLLFGGEEGRIYWFLFTKNLEKTLGNDIPRYKKEAEVNHATKFMNHHVSGDVLFSEIWKHRIVTNFVPIEEMANEHWVWGRIACLGDSVHKMTPNLGQGANCAIESAAELANYLARISKAPASFMDVTQALKSYHKKRHVRANQIVHAANKFTRVEALDSTADFISSMYIIPRLGDILADRGAKVQIGAAKLDALPMPKKALEGTMSWSENVGIGHEEGRKTRQKIAFPFLVLSLFFWWQSCTARTQAARETEAIFQHGIIPLANGTIPLVQHYSGWMALDDVIVKGIARSRLSWNPGPQQRLQLLTLMSNNLAIIVLWMVESFRRGNALTVAHVFPNIFLLLAEFKGLGLTAPIYFFFHYVQSPQENYAALDNRLTNIAFAKTAIFMLVLVITGPVLAIFATEPDMAQWIYGCFGYMLPIRLALVSRILMRCVKDTTPSDRLYQPTADLPYLRFIYGICGLWCTVCHISTTFFSSTNFTDSLIFKFGEIMQLVRYGPSNQAELLEFNFVLTFMAAFLWVLLSFADLKAAKRLKTSWIGIATTLALSAVAFGPGSAILLMWYWREEVMAKKLFLE